MPNTAYPFAGEWTDSQTPALATRPGGSAPKFIALNGGIFGDRYGNGDEAHGSFQMPHSAIGGGELRLHVHFTTAAAITVGQTFIWGLEYSFAGVNDVFPATATVSPAYVIPDVTALRHRVHPLVTITLPTPAASCILMFRVFRTAGTSAVQTYLLSIDGHFQQGQYGTEPEYPS